MTDRAVQNINLNVCKKLDNRVTKVIATASHVVMYSLENGAQWVRDLLLRYRRPVPTHSSKLAQPSTAPHRPHPQPSYWLRRARRD